MTDNDNPLRFSIENGRLYHDSGKNGFREVTHIQRMDGGGIDYLKLWVSGNQVSAGYSVGDPIFTLTHTLEEHLEGNVPGGYDYAWVMAEPEAEPETEPDNVISDSLAPR